MPVLDRLSRSLVLAVIFVIPAGCQSPPSAAEVLGGSVRQLASPAQCGFDSAGAQLLTGPGQWRRSPLGALHSASGWHWLPGTWRLVVSQGRKPTTGFGVQLVSAQRSKSVLAIVVATRQPPANAATGQMLTSPCVVLQVPASGWSLLEVRGLGTSVIRIPHP